jgi:hypothetical protein
VTGLVLRDFDKSGFSIVHTLRTDSRRYTFRTKPKVIDIGLRLDDVRAWGLEALAEPVTYTSNKDPRLGLRAAGATDEECEFLVARGSPRNWSGRRVELNAFTSPQFIAFVEHKLRAAGAAKLVPDGAALAAAWRLAWKKTAVREAIDRAMAALGETPAPAVPPDLREQIARAIDGKAMPWELGLAAVIKRMQSKRTGDGAGAG